MIATLAANAFAVRVYGEIEFSFAILKILTVVGLIIFGICIDLGAGPQGDRIGFRYWRDPGPFAEYLVEGGIGKFVGFWSVLTAAAYSFVGIESTAIVAAETKRPRTVVPEASKRVFFRVGVIYLASLFVISLIVPYTDEGLVAGSGTAATSPFVIAAQRAGINSVASLVNALVICSAFSSGNTGLLNGSRALMGLALDGNAPKFFSRTHKWGVPYYGILFMAAFMPLAYTACSESASTVSASKSELKVQCTALRRGLADPTPLPPSHPHPRRSSTTLSRSRPRVRWSSGWLYASPPSACTTAFVGKASTSRAFLLCLGSSLTWLGSGSSALSWCC